VGSRAGWVVYLVLLLAWIVLGLGRRFRSDTEAGPELRKERQRTLLLFVVGWAVVLMAIAIAWRLFHPA
jgi:succinate dehydrogenase/fumarate reductase cytochrome b subunit